MDSFTANQTNLGLSKNIKPPYHKTGNPYTEAMNKRWHTELGNDQRESLQDKKFKEFLAAAIGYLSTGDSSDGVSSEKIAHILMGKSHESDLPEAIKHQAYDLSQIQKSFIHSFTNAYNKF